MYATLDDYKPTHWGRSLEIIIILAGMAVFFNVAGYLIEESRRWPILNASPRGQCSK